MEKRIEPTPEDIERVAETLKRADLDSQSVDYGDPVNYYRHLARAALSAYLEGR